MQNESAGEFHSDNRRVVICLAISCVMLLISLTLITAGLLIDFPPPVLNKRIILVVFGLIGCLLSVLSIVIHWQKKGQRVELFPGGFRYEKNGRSTSVNWDNVTSIRVSASTIGTSRPLAQTDIWIKTKSGELFYLTSFLVGMERLAGVVLTETSRCMVPAMWSQIQSGETVDFGKLSLSSSRLATVDKELAFDDVDKIRLAHGGIEVIRKNPPGSWYFALVRQMPNYHVFLALTEQLFRVQESERLGDATG